MIYKLPRCFLLSFKSIRLLIQKREIEFQVGDHGGHLAFPSEIILAVFDPHVIPMLPTTFQVHWPFGTGEKNDKYILMMAATAAILDFRSERFWLVMIYKSPLCFLPCFKLISVLVQEKKQKIDFQDGDHGGQLRFPIKTILTIFNQQLR